jgi:hypothetical protein
LSVANEVPEEFISIAMRPAGQPREGMAAVYRFYGSDRALLYIGSTNHPAMRWSRHGERQPWWPEVDAYQLEWWPDRAQAFTEEFKAIWAEAPRYNKRMLLQASEPQPIDEEVQRVFDAIQDVEQIADPEARSRARAQITAKTRELSAEWNAERGELARKLRDEEGESVRGIAKRLGIKPGTVQDLLSGYKGSGATRPKADKPEEASVDGDR